MAVDASHRVMTIHLLIFGLGYTATRLAAAVRASGGGVVACRRQAAPGVLAFDDPAVGAAMARATHILSSVPPAADGVDPVLLHYGALLAAAEPRWLGYLSSIGVYGDAGGAWVDESAPIGSGRRSARAEADLGWQRLSSAGRVFRLPGIYGPGRSALDRVRAGTASRIDAPGHLFSRIHVDDIVTAVIASFERGGPGIYNLADDEPTPGNVVIEYACDLLGIDWPPLQPLATATLSPMSRGFYAENRRVSALKMQRELGIRLRYPSYRCGLLAC